MAKRSKDWSLELADDLRDKRFAQEFILAALEEDVPLQVALGKVIRACGIKEFAERAGMAAPNVSRAINPRYNATHATLNKLLAPFDLTLTVRPLKKEAASRRVGKSMCAAKKRKRLG